MFSQVVTSSAMLSVFLERSEKKGHNCKNKTPCYLFQSEEEVTAKSRSPHISSARGRSIFFRARAQIIAKDYFALTLHEYVFTHTPLENT